MRSSNNYYDFVYKILLLGDSAVGKTCFLLRYADNTFSDNHISTIGLDYRLKVINIDKDKVAKIQIWDTAGQDRFKSITKNYYKGAHGIILIYDVTSVMSFNNIKNWVQQIRENATAKVEIILVGNKIDEENIRKVTTQEGERLAKDFNISFFETSAKNNVGVQEAFGFITNKIYETNTKDNDKTSNINIDKEGKAKKRKQCC